MTRWLMWFLAFVGLGAMLTSFGCTTLPKKAEAFVDLNLDAKSGFEIEGKNVALGPLKGEPADETNSLMTKMCFGPFCWSLDLGVRHIIWGRSENTITVTAKSAAEIEAELKAGVDLDPN